MMYIYNPSPLIIKLIRDEVLDYMMVVGGGTIEREGPATLEQCQRDVQMQEEASHISAPPWVRVKGAGV